MSLVMKDTGGGDFELPSAGTHLARCYLMAELGHQKSVFQGKESIKNQVLIAWELNEKMADGRPFVISRIYTASLNEKANLRADLESWRSKGFTEAELEGFDLKKILGAPCQINVIHKESNGKTYANVKALTSVPKGVNVPELENEAVAYEIHNEAAFTKLPEWMQKKIMERVDPPESENPAPAEFQDDDIDRIPF